MSLDGGVSLVSTDLAMSGSSVFANFRTVSISDVCSAEKEKSIVVAQSHVIYPIKIIWVFYGSLCK